MTLLEAYIFLNSTIAFAKPMYDADGTITGFYQAFSEAANIDVTDDCKIEVLPCYRFDLEKRIFIADVNDEYIADTWEEGMIKLAKIVKERFGDVELLDFYNVDENNVFQKMDNGHYRFNSNACSWDIDAVVREMNKHIW